MKKTLSFFLLLFFIGLLTGCDNQDLVLLENDKTNNSIEASNINTKSSCSLSNAEQCDDKIEVFYFHRTARCYSCKTIEKYVKETIEQDFQEEVKKGRIEFKEINVDLPENKEMAQYFQASGPSLFINKITDGQDNIKQDIEVWQLLGDETKFKAHIKDKINSYLDT